MKIGLISAMQEEMSLIQQAISSPVVTELYQRSYTQGTWNGYDVVATFSMWGKVAAAITAMTLIEHFHCDLLIFSGVAGGLSEELAIGDVVVASHLVQHDMDISAIPIYKKFEIPFLHIAQIPTTPNLADCAEHAAEEFIASDFQRLFSAELLRDFRIQRPKVRRGLVATGDAFVGSEGKVAELRRELPGVLCTEMEGAAVAQVAYDSKIPFAVIRVLSDRADSNAPMDFSRFLGSLAAPMMHGIITRFLGGLRI